MRPALTLFLPSWFGRVRVLHAAAVPQILRYSRAHGHCPILLTRYALDKAVSPSSHPWKVLIALRVEREALSCSKGSQTILVKLRAHAWLFHRERFAKGEHKRVKRREEMIYQLALVSKGGL